MGDRLGGQGVQSEPLQCGGLLGLLHAGGAFPATDAEEEVHALVEGLAAETGAVHDGQRDEISLLDAYSQFLGGLAHCGGVHRLTAFHMTGRPEGPEAIHIAGALTEAEQRFEGLPVGVVVFGGAGQQHVGRGDDVEAFGRCLRICHCAALP